MKKTLQISLEDAKEMIKVLPTMKDTLEELYPELKPSVVPNSWKDLKEINGYIVDNLSDVCSRSLITYSKNKNVFATGKQAKSALAYAQLTQLMKATGDCDVNWDNPNKMKHTIERYSDAIKRNTVCSIYNPIAFKTESIRDEFFNKHQELLKQYYEL